VWGALEEPDARLEMQITQRGGQLEGRFDAQGAEGHVLNGVLLGDSVNVAVDPFFGDTRIVLNGEVHGDSMGGAYEVFLGSTPDRNGAWYARRSH
jgi:hypothetical protein